MREDGYMTSREANADLLAEITALRDRLASLTRENADLHGALNQGSHREAAISQILGVISSSPTDVQPVFDAIVQSATRLCDAAWGAAFRFDGRLQTFTAGCNLTATELEVLRREFPRPLTRERATGRAIADRRVVHIPDLQEDPEFAGAPLRAVGFRSVLAVPMMRQGEPIGVLGLWHRKVQPFTDQQIALVQTLADQAVIAIENVRLFNETKEALERQTATSEVLRVISSSPTDLQLVLKAVAKSAARLCEATDAVIQLRDRDRLVPRAHFGRISHAASVPIVSGSVSGRVAIDGRTIHIHDLMAVENDDEFPVGRAFALQDKVRTHLATPLLREGIVLGVILLRRAEVRPFSEAHVSLLQTFADQAVIAIENVRLFTELQEKNEALTRAHAQVTESLEQQTATSQILEVIASSPTDVQPVF